MQKILIVEDDEKLRKEFEIFLNNNGYESISLKTFENTLNDILEIKPKLLLLDINLPGIDGEYICKELRKVINISVICLMLFMTITSLSSSIALKNSMQKDMEK
ncbi:MAG: response regulator [Firmicutes bacterium]|nr:response regulator [Bacillota bacterium]